MTNDEIHAAIFGQRWRHCTLRIVNGDAITVDHPDYLLMPPEPQPVSVVSGTTPPGAG